MPINCKSQCGNRATLKVSLQTINPRDIPLTMFSPKRPKTGDALCKECFFAAFEAEIHHTISSSNLFRRGEKVAVAASGGKDSTVLAHV